MPITVDATVAPILEKGCVRRLNAVDLPISHHRVRKGAYRLLLDDKPLWDYKKHSFRQAAQTRNWPNASLQKATSIWL